jgi:hypothetical protein
VLMCLVSQIFGREEIRCHRVAKLRKVEHKDLRSIPSLIEGDEHAALCALLKHGRKAAVQLSKRGRNTDMLHLSFAGSVSM